MQRSSDRILTTHTGSLPRPRELTRLYSLARARRRGRRGRDRARGPRRRAPRLWRSSARPASTSATTASSSAIRSFSISRPGSPVSVGAGSGRHAPTSSVIPSSSDVDGAARRPDQVSSLGGLPKAIGEVRYLDRRAINDECAPFQGRARRRAPAPSSSRSCARRRRALSPWRCATSTTTRSEPISRRSARR